MLPQIQEAKASSREAQGLSQARSRQEKQEAEPGTRENRQKEENKTKQRKVTLKHSPILEMARVDLEIFNIVLISIQYSVRGKNSLWATVDHSQITCPQKATSLEVEK